jgi:transglutaminase-like putative cysteine protease
MKKHLILFLSSIFLTGILTGFTWAQEEDTCSSPKKTYYFGVEINGTLCGYYVARICQEEKEGRIILNEFNNVFVKLSILGQGMDMRIRSNFGTDPLLYGFFYNETKIDIGNSHILSTTHIKGDTAYFTGQTGQEEKKLFLGKEVILETGLYFPHLFKDFIQREIMDTLYKVYDPVSGKITEKKYSVAGTEDITLNDSLFHTLVLEETDHSTGSKAKIWLNKEDGLEVKVAVAGRTVYLTDPTVVGRISKVNYDNVIFARVNEIIKDFQNLTYLKVRAKVASTGEALTAENLTFPGQTFTGSVLDNLIEGIFEIEPVKYDGAKAPLFPPDFSDAADLRQYLEPELFIESDDTTLVAEAKTITAGATDSWEAAVRLSRWVAENIRGAIPGGGSAINTHRTREADCGGHSRLLTAFCRATGIPARLATGCIYTPKYGGSFGQHAWTEVYMGDAGWIPVDATVLEVDHVDAGHIRLGEKTTFQPQEMEILEYKVKSGDTTAVPEAYLPYTGKYTNFFMNKVFSVLYRDNALAVDIPGQMILALDDADTEGRWYPKLTKQIHFKFMNDNESQIDKMILIQTVDLPRRGDPETWPVNVPESLIPYLGTYTLAQGNATIDVGFEDGMLAMTDILGRTNQKIRLKEDEGKWKDEQGQYEISFNSDNTGKVTHMTAAMIFMCPRGEPAAFVIESAIKESGIKEGLKKYDELKATGKGQYLFTEQSMNALGYRLLSQDKITEAIEVFKLNVSDYPDSFNVYDSLGEAYMKNGDKKQAIINYEKSLQLNPENENGKNMLEKLNMED